MARLIFPLSIGLLALIVVAALLMGGPHTGIDPAVLALFANDALVPAASLLTHLGDVVTVLAAAVLVAAWLWFRGHRRRAILLVAIVASERLLVEGMKNIFDRARPDPLGHEVAVHNLAFPSGHSANAMAGWLAIALLATSPRLRLPGRRPGPDHRFGHRDLPARPPGPLADRRRRRLGVRGRLDPAPRPSVRNRSSRPALIRAKRRGS